VLACDLPRLPDTSWLMPSLMAITAERCRLLLPPAPADAGGSAAAVAADRRLLSWGFALIFRPALPLLPAAVGGAGDGDAARLPPLLPAAADEEAGPPVSLVRLSLPRLVPLLAVSESTSSPPSAASAATR
jgi:hypothetical protein